MLLEYEFELEGDNYLTIDLSLSSVSIIFTIDDYDDCPSKNWKDFLSHTDVSTPFEINLKSEDDDQIKFIKDNLTEKITITCDDFATISVPIPKLEQFIKDLIVELEKIEKKLGH